MEREELRLLRIAVAVPEASMMERIKYQLIRFALQTDCEIDIAEIGKNFCALEKSIQNIDLAILDYRFLDQNKMSLSALYKNNPDCLSVPLGKPESEICKYLIVRPGGHLQSTDENDELHKICSFCIKELIENGNILQFSTKKGLFSISIRSIIFCQSDLKYISVVTEEGMKYRKLGKLDNLSEKLPRNFIRVHKSYLVNLNQVYGIDRASNELLLKEGIRIPYSRAYQSFVLKIFQNGMFDVQI